MIKNKRTSAVELESRLQRDFFQGRVRLGVRLLSSVQAVDVGLVMLRMMQPHDFLRNMWFESLWVRHLVGESTCETGGRLTL